MRREYLVCYDISDARRLRAVFRIVRGYGDALQYSVFRCLLSGTEKVRLLAELDEVIHARDDQVLLVDLGTETRARAVFETLGRVLAHPERDVIVI